MFTIDVWLLLGGVVLMALWLNYFFRRYEPFPKNDEEKVKKY